MLGAFLAAASVRPAGAEVLSNTSVPMEGMLLPHPCTLETLSFRGSLYLQARATVSGPNATVGLHVNTQGVTATGQVTGNRYNNSDVLNTTLNVGPLPATTTVVAKVQFSGPGANRFRAHVTLHVTVSPSGAVSASLGSVQMECL